MKPIVAVIEPGVYIAFGTLIVGIIGAIVGLFKVKPEAESIATRTTLEVIESQRVQLKEAREETGQLRASLRSREEELDALHRRFTTLRLDFDALEGELNALRGGKASA